MRIGSRCVGEIAIPNDTSAIRTLALLLHPLLLAACIDSSLNADEVVRTCISTLESYDWDADAKVDVIVEIYANAEGLQVLRRTDVALDGKFEREARYTYDGEGRLLREEYDEGADGSADISHTMAYDDDGKQVSLESDYDGDGLADIRTAFYYDSNGWLVDQISDLDGDGDDDWSQQTEYDDAGNPTSVVDDSAADGLPDVIVRMQYADGKIIVKKTDLLADGTWDELVEYRYDGAFNLVEVDYDEAADGSIETWVMLDYDVERRLSASEQHSDAGIELYWMWSYDASDLVLQYAAWYGDGVPFFRWDYAYDDVGRTLGIWYDPNGDDVTDEIWTYSYGDC